MLLFQVIRRLQQKMVTSGLPDPADNVCGKEFSSPPESTPDSQFFSRLHLSIGRFLDITQNLSTMVGVSSLPCSRAFAYLPTKEPLKYIRIFVSEVSRHNAQLEISVIGYQSLREAYPFLGKTIPDARLKLHLKRALQCPQCDPEHRGEAGYSNSQMAVIEHCDMTNEMRRVSQLKRLFANGHLSS
jgi:hypothetical protein